MMQTLNVIFVNTIYISGYQTRVGILNDHVHVAAGRDLNVTSSQCYLGLYILECPIL